VLLHRLRLDQDVLPKLSATLTGLILSCDKTLLAQRNLLLADLKREQLWLKDVNIDLDY
jgi:hypothetical protein